MAENIEMEKSVEPTVDEKASTAEDIPSQIQTGKRLLDKSQYAAAVEHFATMCDNLVPIHGDMGDVLGEVYLYYGQALLNLGRKDPTLLNELNLPKVEEDSSSENEEEDEEENDAEPENPEEDDKEKDEKETKNNGDSEKPVEKSNDNKDDKADEQKESNDSKQSETTEKKSGENETTQNGLSASEAKDQKPGCSGEQNIENDENLSEEDEDVSNFQLAWEILELAKKIFTERKEEGLENLIDTMYSLGDLSLEVANYDTAIDDFKVCLELQEKGKDDIRRAADTYFKIGLAYMSCDDCDNSKEYFLKAKDAVIKFRDSIEPASDSVEDEDKFKKLYFDLEDIIADLDFKIKDVIECREMDKNKIKEMLRSLPEKSEIDIPGPSINLPGFNVGITEKAPHLSTAPQVPASNISHLVRRKRTSDDSIEHEVSPAKKASPSIKTPEKSSDN